MPTQLQIKSKAETIQLKATGILGARTKTMLFESSDRLWSVKIPTTFFPDFSPGDSAIAAVVLTRFAVDSLPEPAEMLPQ
jgi:hypothetical protein